jgi:nicotinamide-nucleotide adenylyltransferase
VIEIGVVHGRFQVLHNDHMKYIQAAKARCRRLVVGITNPDPTLTRDEAGDPKRGLPSSNPLTYFERHVLVRRALTRAGLDGDEFWAVPLPISFPELYKYYVPMDAVFFLTIYDQWGRSKLERFKNLGLATRVLWEKTEAEKGITGTEVRRRMAHGEPWEDLVPAGTAALLKNWDIPGRLQRGGYYSKRSTHQEL